jgi:hypothetical protein
MSLVDLLAELEETSDSIVSKFQSGKDPSKEQNTLKDILAELKNRKGQFSNQNSFDNLVLAAEKLAQTKSLTESKMSVVTVTLEELLKDLREPNKSSNLLNLANGLAIPKITTKKAALPSQANLTFAGANQKTGKCEGQKDDQELENSFNLLKNSILSVNNNMSMLNSVIEF